MVIVTEKGEFKLIEADRTYLTFKNIKTKEVFKVTHEQFRKSKHYF